MIELRLLYPPSVNHYKNVGRLKTTKSGKMYQERINSPETVRYFYEVWYMFQQKKAREGVKSLDDAKISLEIEVYPPDARKRDLDNVCKVTIDALVKAGCFYDDYQVDKLLVERKRVTKGGQLIVRIAPIY